ncbi:lysophospholipid acyltransferase family protein [Ramlibacter albus]|uniref:1-acyl-sn-glycerol-3-phosphate acyltransferase n=1 Tax=Ramlibacter albus TaxID=2079448 RepID=A0A923M592_9BURK|nr:lysophospholipid acyltransferase family protein [Ramlibacter albus]MBC5763168.1 1-acyl-sn-glycerol-3-phosphate acyltransferase [Ramlibacter albus]
MGAHLKAAWRLARALLHAVGGWFTITFAFPRLTQAERNERVQAWAARMLQVMGVQLRVEGTPPAAGPVLLVANHISWLDILVMHAARHCRFVAKADIKRWPLIGPLATGGGTLYIERESRRDAMRVVHHMAESLRAGQVVGVFPEGTTTDGTFVLPFHANLLQAAISAGAPVQPMALSFLDREGNTSLAPRYDGDISLLQSAWATLSADITAVVAFGEPQAAQGRDRRAWAHDLRDAVVNLRGGR